MNSVAMLLTASLLLWGGGDDDKKKPVRGTAVYQRHEQADVSAYRDRVDFTMPEPKAPAPLIVPVQVPAGKSVAPYFKGGARVYVDADPRLEQLVTRHTQLNQKIEKIQGFRVQVYVGNDRDAANAARQSLLSLYTDSPSYVDFVTPNYTVKTGDFPERERAAEFCRLVRQTFPGAVVVPDQVVVRRISPGSDGNRP
ncbi:MAG: SPOR domain-containing protein [Bacteroidia bacterium]|nr:SPOR domain-containing protein [Bacteroidia bacterium]